ncbi:NADP-dependent phosphogluconate dehydrogenase [Christiangramia flava]|uniref:6-phosphogluconate dehydrogenase, decarboxylating n=1 Tax=Christiangramia flava JLT2011 TaxID=1229726 RepID=A0A1L7I8P6_9FLAO|nr:NADP-dependent phosphogluconate dehydrogenase [Christiangramia flava]APU69978.1 6-phosphogluconate dehydrogenase, decarboxylating [Christiangramia flava JLT2011]OSS39463.1 6-phosphogluconate dehydrogenase, decarboxylating [Christiangramia flava JLT2011]
MSIYILMGVSGVGKTTLGKSLAKHLQTPFYDADDFHSEKNIQKMSKGFPLNDEDRESWLENIKNAMQSWEDSGGAVLACSALKEKYRQHLKQSGVSITWIYLYESFETISHRLEQRSGHYFKAALLNSQFETLEPPKYGLHIRVDDTAEKTMHKIMKKLELPEIGLIGLGVMGKSLALNMASKQIPIAVYNREVQGSEEGVARDFANSHPDHQIPWFDDLQVFVKSLPKPRNIFLMVNAGKAVDSVIQQLIPHLDKGDLIIDGGNSHYTDTQRRAKKLKEKEILFLGTGVSGGEEGALKGPSIMPGGDRKAYDRVGNVLEAIAAKDHQENPCCTYIGPGASGHFVKMLHNGIEYGEMQLIAEFYQLLRFRLHYQPEQIADLFLDWNKDMKSYLLSISVEILRFQEKNELLLDKILDAAGQKGTGSWSSIAALNLGVPFDTITTAVMARNISAEKELRLTFAEIFKHTEHFLEISEEELFKAYKLASLINHATGFELLRAASSEYNWQLNFSEIARIWTNGCIIKSGLMQQLSELLKDSAGQHVLSLEAFREMIETNKSSLAFVVGKSVEAENPLPVASAALNYFWNLTSATTSANMIQAQRDYFGAHTYERTDGKRGEFHHTNWSKS